MPCCALIAHLRVDAIPGFSALSRFKLVIPSLGPYSQLRVSDAAVSADTELRLFGVRLRTRNSESISSKIRNSVIFD